MSLNDCLEAFTKEEVLDGDEMPVRQINRQVDRQIEDIQKIDRRHSDMQTDSQIVRQTD